MTTFDINTTQRARDAKPFAEHARSLAMAAFGTEARLLLTILALLTIWGGAIAAWGYPALIVVALCLVPAMFAVLMLITVGK